MKRPQVMAIRNSTGSPLSRLADWFVEDGLDVTEIPGEELGSTALDGVHGLVLLGGGFMPGDDDRAAWLPLERSLTARALTDELPLLGICLGAQLIAHVAGGRVVRDHGEPERGSCPVRLTAATAGDPLLAGLPQAFPAIQNHADQIVELPPDAVLLATSEVCRVQAFRVGAAAWGVQFHPEAAASRLASWDGTALAGEGFDLAALRRTAAVVEPQSVEVARVMARRFAAEVSRRATHSSSAGQRVAHSADTIS